MLANHTEQLEKILSEVECYSLAEHEYNPEDPDEISLPCIGCYPDKFLGKGAKKAGYPTVNTTLTRDEFQALFDCPAFQRDPRKGDSNPLPICAGIIGEKLRCLNAEDLINSGLTPRTEMIVEPRAYCPVALLIESLKKTSRVRVK